jgi:hypothetical protein
MEVTDEAHATAALHLGKEPPKPTDQFGGWPTVDVLDSGYTGTGIQV